MKDHDEYFFQELYLKDGPVIVDFDFIPRPQQPTKEQVLSLCPRKCETCDCVDPDLRVPGCRYGEPGETGENCQYWDTDDPSDAYEAAYNKWWLNFHEKTMKGRPTPELRNHHYWPDDIHFVSYPENA